MVATARELRREPLRELDAEDLRLLIGQHLGLPALIPRAVAPLERDPLVEGDLYPGDLLVAVLRAPASHWRARPADLASLERSWTGSSPDTHVAAAIDAFRA